MIRTLAGITPKIADTAWVSEFAYVVGNVEIGEFASIWPGVTIRGDSPDAIVIGDYVNIQEGSVIHGNGLTIEEHVSVGHSVVVHCDLVGKGSLLGNNFFGRPQSVESWSFGIPSLWVWQIIFWIIGVFIVWFLASKMEMSTSPKKNIISQGKKGSW